MENSQDFSVPSSSGKVYSHIDDGQLIEHVSNHSVLWNPNHPDNKSNAKKDVVWNKIGAQMNYPGDHCKERWRSIRDNYKRHKKMESSGSGKPVMKKRANYWEQLRFLEAVYGDRQRENLELMILKKKECTAKALQCVETLIELNVLESTFRQTLPHINQSTYQDVVDERSITYVCGYPLCSSQLKNIPKKQYSIVRCKGQLTLFNTVERKKFCSNICYKASKFIYDQLPSSPLWLIETKETDQFTLLPLDSSSSRCSYGEEIQLDVERPATVQDKESPTTNESHQNESQTSGLKNNSDNKCIDPSKLNDQSRSNDEGYFDSCSSLDNDHENSKAAKHGVDSRDSLAVEDHIKHRTAVTNDNYSNSNEVLSEETNKNGGNEEVLSEETNKNGGNEEEVLSEETNKNGGNEEEVLSEETNKNGGNEESSKVIESSLSKIEEKINEQGSNLESTIKTESNLNHGIQSIDMKVNQLDKMNVGKESVIVDAELNVNTKEENIKVKVKRKKSDKEKRREHSEPSPVLAAVSNTERKIREWISVETLNFIFGSEKLRNILEEHGLLAKLQEKNIDSARDPYLFERYVEICTKLNILDLKDSKFDKEVKNESTVPTKPLPDFEKLKEEAKAMELKVRSFYAGDKRVQFSEAIIEESETKDEKQNVLPLVDQHAQHAFRRRIVLDHLNKVLPDVLKTIGITNLISKKDIRDLVHTFTLSANNVVFKPIEWQFIAIIIVKLFSVRDEELAKLLATEKVRKYLTLILMSYEQDSEYLNRLMTWLLYEHSLFQA